VDENGRYFTDTNLRSDVVPQARARRGTCEPARVGSSERGERRLDALALRVGDQAGHHLSKVRLLSARVDVLPAVRLQVATQRLRNTSASLAQVAETVGYDSEAAFSRAFGAAPATWRRSNS